MALPNMEDFEESLYEAVLDDDDPFPLDDPLDQYSTGSPYIEEGKPNDFFQFHDASAINLMHISCRNLRNNFREIVSFLG